MQEVFEKILSFVDEQIKIEESIAKSENEGHPITHQYGANCMNVIKKFVQEVAEEYNVGWIPCSERLPDVSELGYGDFNVTIKGATESITLTYYEDVGWTDNEGNYFNVVAWMPLPEAFKESDKNVQV